MWIFDRRSFTSTVAYDATKDREKDSQYKKIVEESGNPKGWLLIRARVKADLEAMAEQMGVDVHLTEDKWADYSFRALVTREDMKAYLAKQVDEIDYDSHFKEVVEKHATQGKARHSAMMRVWSAMADLQPTSPYGAYSGSSYYGGGTYVSTGKGKSTGSNGFSTGIYGDDWDYDYGVAPVKSTNLPKEPVEFIPSAIVTNLATMRDLLTTFPTAEFPDDILEAADDYAFNLYLQASLTYPEDAALTEAQVTDLCDFLNTQQYDTNRR